jgi:glycosyltransferase involved in cell wall biosynthesis
MAAVSRPSLSVCLCNYNHGHLLGRALDAIVGQSLAPLELVLVDDASTDGSLDVIEPYTRRHPWIRLVRNRQNRGALGAMNQSFALARGDYVYPAAADDYVLPGAFEAALSMASRHPGAGIVFGQMEILRPDGSRVRTSAATSWPSSRYVDPRAFLREYLEVESPHHSLSAATFYRRDAWKEIGFYREELGFWADTFALRALGLMHGAAYVCAPLAAWTYADDSLSGTARHDPHVSLDTIDRMTRLMRSEPFRPYFPEDYVASWARAYRAQHIRFVGKAVRRELRQRLEGLAGGSRPLPLRLLTGAIAELAALAARRSLRRYRPGVTGPEKEPAAATRASRRDPLDAPGPWT